MKSKHLRKALESLAEEGVTQLFTPALGSDMIVGAVGSLQIDVMAERMTAEYNLDVTFEPAPYETARWISGSEADIESFGNRHKSAIAEDIDGDPVFLAKSSWEVNYSEEKWPKLKFHRTKERGQTS